MLIKSEIKENLREQEMQTEAEFCASHKLDLLEGGELLEDFQNVPKMVKIDKKEEILPLFKDQ